MSLSDDVTFVLVEPEFGGNLGACARALKNTGFSRWALVDSRVEDWREARKMAVHAADVLERAARFESLPDAIADTHWVVGVSGRARSHPDRKPPFEPDELIRRLRKQPPGVRTALIFGSERTGLTNDHLGFCQDILTLPTSAACPSLNLASAVLLVAWEIRRARLAEKPVAEKPGIVADRLPVNRRELDGLLAHARRTLDLIGYLDKQNPQPVLDDLRKVFARSDLDRRELQMLRGIFHRMDVWISQHGGPPTPNQKRSKHDLEI
jgi:tRNA/rRNA methyltransferase